MDLLYFLTQRLDFVQQLYDSAVAPFEEKKRRIDGGEEPYVDTGSPEDRDEPAYLSEWQDADDSVMVLGHWSLCMVQAMLKAYLEESISPSGSYWWDSSEVRRLLEQKPKKDSWFERYRLLYLEDLGVDWRQGRVQPDDLEQLNLTRNDLFHEIDLATFTVERDHKHAARFRTRLFTDVLWTEWGAERIRIDRAQLELAIRLVGDFCSWLDGIRCDYPRFRRALEAGEPWAPSLRT